MKVKVKEEGSGKKERKNERMKERKKERSIKVRLRTCQKKKKQMEEKM